MRVKITTKEFIQKAIKIHGSKYNYDNVVYVNNITSVIITCKKHGDFKQVARYHLQGSGCPKCGIKSGALLRAKTTKQFITKAEKKHNNFYSYTKVVYKNAKGLVVITCPKHGDFLQEAYSHLNGYGCGKCSESFMDKDYFVLKAKEVHNNIYKYEHVIYTNSKKNVLITCPKHGDFLQRPNHHLQGSGCPRCNMSKGEVKIDRFLKSNDIIYFTQHKFKDCSYKSTLLFDFYLPNENICIEYDGEQHYKPVAHFGGKKNFKQLQIRDKIKTNYCIKNNIRLLRIPYINFNDIEEILQRGLANEIYT